MILHIVKIFPSAATTTKKVKETNKIKEHPPLNIYTFTLKKKQKSKKKWKNFVYLHMEHRLFFLNLSEFLHNVQLVLCSEYWLFKFKNTNSWFKCVFYEMYKRIHSCVITIDYVSWMFCEKFLLIFFMCLLWGDFITFQSHWPKMCKHLPLTCLLR